MNIKDKLEITRSATSGPWYYTRAYGLATIVSKENPAIAHAVEYLKTGDAEFICMARNEYEKDLLRLERAEELLKSILMGESSQLTYNELCSIREFLKEIKEKVDG